MMQNNKLLSRIKLLWDEMPQIPYYKGIWLEARAGTLWGVSVHCEDEVVEVYLPNGNRRTGGLDERE